MRHYQTDIFKFCNNYTKDAFSAFCEKVNHSKADVFLIMAHKAVQLFFILLEQGYINDTIRKRIIIAHQSLDFDCSYLQGKKIAIVDDIVISGTSLASTVHKLLAMGISSGDIEIIAIAKDLDYFRMRFTDAAGNSILHCNTELKDADCIDLSATVSKIFSHYGVPYDVDFPVYESIQINHKALNLFHDNIFWDILDVTNENQQAGKVSSYTLYPMSCIRQKLWDLIGVELEGCVHLKVRTYIKKSPNGMLELSVVPMCLFNEISEENLAKLYYALKPSEKNIILNQHNLPIAQMRYLQFYIAHQLYVLFSEVMSLGEGALPQKEVLLQLFGLIDGEIVYNAICMSCHRKVDSVTPKICVEKPNDSALLLEYSESSIGQHSLEELQCFEQGNAFQNMCWINQTILNPFLWWYDAKEIKVREKLRDSALHYIDDQEKIDKVLYRLNSGFSLSTLRNILSMQLPAIQVGLSTEEMNRTISSFLDRAIDEGIIVPTISYQTGKDTKAYLCRVYRHGEDLPFGVADKCRLLLFIQQLGNRIPNIVKEGRGESKTEGIAKVSLEKMIVLFFQIGLRKGGIFNRFLGFDTLKILRPFLSVHGRVMAYTKAGETEEIHMYSEKSSNNEQYINWLTSWLTKKCFIVVDEDETDKTINQKQKINLTLINNHLALETRSSICPSIRADIINIANILATWYQKACEDPSPMKFSFKDAATAITSCATEYVYASAIATEIHYFSKFWSKQVKDTIKTACPSSLFSFQLKQDNYAKMTLQGLNSGRDKVTWFKENVAATAIEDVATILSETDRDTWLSAIRGGHFSRDNELELENLTHAAVAFLYLFSICYDCLMLEQFWSEGEMPKKYDTYREQFLGAAYLTDRIDTRWLDDLTEIAAIPESDILNKIERFDDFVTGLIDLSETCVSDIEENIKGYTPSRYTVKYESALIVDIKPLPAFNYKKINAMLTDLWINLPDDQSKTELNIVQFPSLPSTTPAIRYGIFYNSTAQTQLPDLPSCAIKSNEDMLFDMFVSVRQLFDGKVYEIHSIMLPHIQPAYGFKHNLQKNIQENAEAFYSQVIQFLEIHYDKTAKVQLILGEDRNTPQNFSQRFATWEKINEVQKIENARWLTSCKVYCYGYTAVPVVGAAHRIIYSLLRITCQNNHGFGFLLGLSDQVVCVSCNHLFEAHQKDGAEIVATSVYDPRITFQLENITSIKSYRRPDDLLPVTDEVAILAPIWNCQIPFDFSCLLQKSDLDLDTDKHEGQDCLCIGGKPDQSVQWSQNPFVLRGIAEHGYYKLSGDLKQLESGFSGGIYKPMHSPLMIGIHEGRAPSISHTRMISCRSIIETISQEVENGSEANND